MDEARVVAGRYTLIRPLGRGGMGAVWLGEDRLAGRQVAVKELRAPSGVTDEERDVFMKRALQEARSAARLTHPNAVTLHDIVPASQDDDAVYLVMEYVDGVTLAQLVRQEGPLRPDRAAGLALQLLSMLEAAHALGIVHRDIKPSNIMVTANGQVKLTDFGIAHMVGGTRLTGSGVIGTPAYMAPEQIQGLAITPAVDLWALGATLFDVVEGRNPFDRETTVATFHAILMADLPVPTSAPPLGPVIAGLLVREPDRRMTIAQARQSLAGGTAWHAAPGVNAGLADGASAGTTGTSGISPGATGASPHSGAGPATHPHGAANSGNPLYSGNPTYPGTPAFPENPGYPGTPPYPGSPATLPVARSRPGRRPVVLAGAGVAAVAVIAAITVLTLHRTGSSPPPAPSPPETATSGSALGTESAASSGPATAPASQAVAAAGANAIPSAYLGRWHGTLADHIGLEGPQEAQLSVTSGAVGSVVGSASYPSVGCTYSLTLYSVKADQVTLQEKVESGPCVADWVVLATDGDRLNETVYSVSLSQGRADFSGPLSRAS